MFLGRVAASDADANDPAGESTGCSAAVEALAEVRASALRTTIRLTARLSTILAVIDLFAAHGIASVEPSVKPNLMRAIRALHTLRHDLLRLDAAIREGGWS